LNYEITFLQMWAGTAQRPADMPDVSPALHERLARERAQTRTQTQSRSQIMKSDFSHWEALPKLGKIKLDGKHTAELRGFFDIKGHQSVHLLYVGANLTLHVPMSCEPNWTVNPQLLEAAKEQLLKSILSRK
jgi:hypothetical protein